MEDLNEDSQGTRTLNTNQSYKIGDFRLIFDEETNTLKVIVETHNRNLMINPSSSNSAILIAQKK